MIFDPFPEDFEDEDDDDDEDDFAYRLEDERRFDPKLTEDALQRAYVT